jgi:16S rRNA U516 pseudouridylate synthase RsuA-like enzyme
MEQRLQKLIAAAGISSRRHAEELITSGKVSVNGKTVTELGAKADPEHDHIKVNGKLINPLLKRQEHIYVLLNKPKGYLTSMSDPEDRPLVTDLIPKSLGACIRLAGSISTRRVAAADDRRRTDQFHYVRAQQDRKSLQRQGERNAER